MVSVVARTVIVYIILSFSLRMMGKRQLGELEVGELVSTLLVSEIASIPIDNPDIPLLNAIIPIIFILAVEIILSTVKNKSEKMKGLLEGKPQYIIYKGRLLQQALRDNRISVNELLSELRAQGVGDIDEVYYAAIEKNGTLSILKKGDPEMAHPIIIDGSIIEENLKPSVYTGDKLNRILENKRIAKEDVFLMTATDSGRIKIIMKDESDK